MEVVLVVDMVILKAMESILAMEIAKVMITESFCGIVEMEYHMDFENYMYINKEILRNYDGTFNSNSVFGCGYYGDSNGGGGFMKMR
jgi:hypothetical protein